MNKCKCKHCQKPIQITNPYYNPEGKHIPISEAEIMHRERVIKNRDTTIRGPI